MVFGAGPVNAVRDVLSIRVCENRAGAPAGRLRESRRGPRKEVPEHVKSAGTREAGCVRCSLTGENTGK